jgi:PAS domain S-box-containing protein
MSLHNPFVIGAMMVAAGLFLWLAARLVINRLTLAKPEEKIAIKQTAPEVDTSAEAVLLIRQGGRLVWLSQPARVLFEIRAGAPADLELLARQIRPADEFIRLCARGGQARFILNGRTLEVDSSGFILNGEQYRLVALRETSLGLELAGSDPGRQGAALESFNRLALALGSHLDLESTLRAIAENLARLLPLDGLEICLWDASSERLTAYRLNSTPGSEFILEKIPNLYRKSEGLVGKLAEERKPLLFNDPAGCDQIMPVFTQSRMKIKACLGVPLFAGDEMVGTLAVASLSQGRFQSTDLDLLSALAGHAAVALRKARLFEQERRRAAELDSLAQLTQAFGSIRDPHRLYAHLIECISPLVRVGILGFLIFNENERMLEGRAPIRGLPVQFIEMIRVPVPGGSPLEAAYLAQEVIQSANAAEDSRWQEMGLQPLAAAASLRETVLVPLVSGGSMLGYLLAANPGEDRRGFSEDELRLLRILASQSAPIIENATLFQQLTLRAQRAETLRQIASLASSTSSLEDILRSSLEELCRLLEADAAAVFLLDQQRTTLALLRPASSDDFTHVSDKLARLAVEDPQFPFTATGSQHMIYSGKVLPEKPLVPFYRQVMNTLQVESLVAAPLVVRGKGIAEIWVCSRRADKFGTGDLQVISSAAGQLAGVVENALEDRTEALRREHRRLQTMLRVSTELSSSLDIQQVLQRTLAVVNKALGAEESLILTGQGEDIFRAGEALASVGEDGKLEPDSPERQIARAVIQSRAPVLVDHLAADTRWNPTKGQPPAAGSLLGIPLILGEEVPGSLLLLHSQPGRFQETQIELLEAIARQIASTLKNSELFNLIRDQAEKLGGMLREQQIEASRSRAILEAVADGVVVTGAQGQITLFNPSAGRILGAAAGQLIWQPLDRLDSLVGQAGEEWLGAIHAWTEAPLTVHEGQTYAAQVNLENGRVVSIHLAPVIWRSSFLGTVSIFRDITHQVQVDRLKSEFITNVSHELRTPLTSIKGYADILLMGAAGELSAQQKHFIQVIRENSLRLQGLVDDLLNVSHIQAGKVVLDYQPVDMAEIAHGVADEIRQLSQQENKAISVRVEMLPDLPHAYGDRERTRQVLRSLALNGYKYTPESGEVTIRVRQVHPGELQVDVQDNGIGIPREDQPRIFERFFRGEHPLIMASAGAGLGLALAKILVEMQGGRIWFASSGVPGEGSLFSFTLPVKVVEG